MATTNPKPDPADELTFVLQNRVRMIYEQMGRIREQAKAFHLGRPDRLTRATREWESRPTPPLVVWPAFEAGALVFRGPQGPVYQTPLLARMLDVPPPPGFPATRFVGWLDTRDPRRYRICRAGRWFAAPDPLGRYGVIWQRYRLTSGRDAIPYRQFIVENKPPDDWRESWAPYPIVSRGKTVAIQADMGQDSWEPRPKADLLGE